MEQTNLDKINQDVLMLKQQMAEMQKLIMEKMEFARETEEAWQEVDEGKCKCLSKNEFLEEIERW